MYSLHIIRKQITTNMNRTDIYINHYTKMFIIGLAFIHMLISSIFLFRAFTLREYPKFAMIILILLIIGYTLSLILLIITQTSSNYSYITMMIVFTIPFVSSIFLY